ncbi:MAG: RnfABCDGE type electron transport complex subunit D [Cellulosilyticaceae bacterium]
MEKLLKVSSSPHIKAKQSVRSIMLDVTIALVPALLVSIYFFGLRALLVVIVSVVSCVAFEALWQKFTKQPITIKDFSAVVTALLLAFNLPVTIPIYAIIVGAFVAIILAKQCFGGLGQNFINPALAARAFLLAAYPQAMTNFVNPVDGVAAATPLAQLKGGAGMEQLPSLMNVFIGNVGGCIGEVSALALLLGAAYLVYKKVITLHIPLCYMGTIFMINLVFGGQGVQGSLYSLLLGGVILGAFFMATDYTTTPMTRKGQIIFAVGAGIITAVIRLFGGYPEGVSYSILLMNLTVPLIDRFVKTKKFGGGQKA